MMMQGIRRSLRSQAQGSRNERVPCTFNYKASGFGHIISIVTGGTSLCLSQYFCRVRPADPCGQDCFDAKAPARCAAVAKQIP